MTDINDMPLAGPPFCVIQEGKQKSRDLADAIIAGYGGGTIGYCTPAQDIREEYTPVFIGVHPSTVDILREVRRYRRPYVTIDNGYFKGYKEGGYFRGTTNAMQWVAESARGDTWKHRTPLDEAAGKARWEALDIKLARWDPFFEKKSILIALQSPVWLDMMGQPVGLVDDWIKTLKAHTKRKIIVRHKPLKGAAPQPPLEEHLAEAQCVVAFSSNVLIKAAIAGVPVFPQALCAASPLGKSTLFFTDTPARPPRERVMYELAANQWTMEEIASGMMWRDLQTRYDEEHFWPA